MHKRIDKTAEVGNARVLDDAAGELDDEDEEEVGQTEDCAKFQDVNRLSPRLTIFECEPRASDYLPSKFALLPVL